MCSGSRVREVEAVVLKPSLSGTTNHTCMSKQRVVWGVFEAETAYPSTVVADEAAVQCEFDGPIGMQSSAILHIIELMLCTVDFICAGAHPKDSVMQIGQLFCIHRTWFELQ